MAGVGPQLPKKQLATAVHRGPAIRAWCGPLPLVLLVGFCNVFVFSACCLMYRCVGCAAGKKH